MESTRTEAPRCLVVEDQALIALSIEANLEDAGFVVATCSTAREALAIVAERPPDCILLDFALKDGPCLELARELLHRGVPFVVYSGHRRTSFDLPELEAVPWIDKPAPREDLIASLSSTLARGIRTAPSTLLDG
jgi:DNA-binding response OmpR family regulator